jgi:Domain of unknown function (DUF4265)
MSERVKLRFPFANSAGSNETETMWALKRDDGYEIDNIPFYVKELALGDCASEVSELPRFVAVDIPPSVPYEKVKGWLDQREQAGTFEYQEACLGFV